MGLKVRHILIWSFLVFMVLMTGCKGQSHETHSKDDKLRGLGYLSGVETLPEDVGVTVRKRPPTDNVYVYQSSDTYKIRMMNDTGTILHTWDVNYWNAFDTLPPIKIYTDTGLKSSHSFYAFPDGRLLVFYYQAGMAMINKNSEVLWSRLNYAHHKMDVRGETLYVVHWKPRVLKWEGRKWMVMDGVISAYSMEGKQKWSISLFDALNRSEYYGLLRFIDPSHWDLFHTNDIDLLKIEKKSNVFKGADALISSRKLNSVMALDFDARSITWALTGMTDLQHDPDFLKNGNLLIFDNGNIRSQSRVLEVKPATKEILWKYDKSGFFTRCCGGQQRLDDGNTLIIESQAGRAFEVTPHGEIVWEWINSETGYGRPDKIASVGMMERYPVDYFTFME